MKKKIGILYVICVIVGICMVVCAYLVSNYMHMNGISIYVGKFLFFAGLIIALCPAEILIVTNQPAETKKTAVLKRMEERKQESEK